MAAELLITPARATDSDGNPYSGAKWYFYLTGTTTPANVYADSGLGSSLGSVVTADASGKFTSVYFDASIIYRGVCKNSDGSVTLHDIDPINAGIISVLSASGGSSLVSFLQTGTGAVVRTVQNRLRDGISVKDFGAVGDGTTDDRAAIALSDAAGAFHFVSGSYKIASNITISNDVTFEPGAMLVVPTGITVTLSGRIQAGAARIFSCTGTGAVVIDGRNNPKGWAEWWGLVPESPGDATANTTAINAAVTALRETRLLAKTYYTATQITISLSNHILSGSGSQYDGVNEGQITRILCTSATAHIIYAGGTSFSTITAMPRGIVVRNIFVSRSVSPDITSGCTGVYAKWCQFSRLENVKSANSQHAFQFSGTVQQKAVCCHAFRDSVGTGGTDAFNGFYIEGATSIGLNSSNPSLRMIRPVTEMGIAIAASRGIYADHKMTDLFIEQPETTACATGIEIYGDSSNTTLNQDNTDVQIVGPVVDQFTFAGIYIHGMNKFGSAEVIGGYYGAASGATASFLVSDNLATVRVSGGQFLMAVSTTTYGVRIATASNVIVEGCVINESTAAAVVMDNANNCKIEPFVKNNSITCSAAVQMYNACAANYIAPMISGGANKVQYGIQVIGTGDARNEYNVSGMDSGCMPAANRKLDRNGTPVVAIGLAGSNYATGVFT